MSRVGVSDGLSGAAELEDGHAATLHVEQRLGERLQ